MNPEQHNANVGLPSFQSFFHGQNGMNRPHPHESHMLNRPHQAEIHAMNRHGHGPMGDSMLTHASLWYKQSNFDYHNQHDVNH
jgi:hypothetical protein